MLDALRGRIAAFRGEALGDLAVERGWLTDEQVGDALELVDTGATDRDLGDLLVERGLLTREQVGELLAARRTMELGDLLARSSTDTPTEASLVAADPARRFGRFVLVEEIGRGGMGVVYKAWQPDMGRWVAVKRLKPDGSGGVARFLREGRLAGRVLHPNLVPVHEVGEVEGRPYLAMALIDGGSLDGRSLPIRRALEVIHQVARATEALHQAGILHRDIKPGNVLEDRDGRIYLGDFGLARSGDAPGLSKSGTMVGTPVYAPPEQIRGDRAAIGPRSDVYSLGATLWSLLTGAPPFSGSDVVEIASKVVHEDPPALRSRRPDVNTQIQTIVWKAMRKRPEDRYASAAAFADDVRRYLDGRTLLARAPGPLDRLLDAVGRKKLLVGAVAACVALAAAIPWLVSESRRQGEKSAAAAAETRAKAHREASEALWRYVHLPGSGSAASAAQNESVALIDRCLKEWPDSLEARILKVHHLLRANDVREATRTLAEATALDAARPEIRFLNARFRSAEIVEELDEMRGMGGVNEESPADAERRGRLVAEAEGALDAVRGKPGIRDYQTAILEAHLALARRDWAGAARRFDAYLDAVPSDYAALKMAATAELRGGDPKRALARMDEALRIEPSPTAFLMRSTVHARLGDLDKALEDLERCDPRRVETQLSRGKYLVRLARAPEAIRAFDEALRLDPRSGLAHYLRGNARIEARDAQGAIADYNKALELGIGEGPVLGDRSEAYFMLGERQKAAADLDRAIRITSGRARALFTVRWCHHASKDVRDAGDAASRRPIIEGMKSRAEEGLTADPSVPDNRYWRGVCRFSLTEYGGAPAAGELAGIRADLEEYLRRVPTGRLADNARTLLEQVREREGG